ncbi:RING-H2 finger protein ATL43 [Mercurialis annua]|uniref:RING-H2 finger protein ATL43 n=1 Tax=Mercurialis annua TaxID=3986 RepID=UPI002160D53E|nr:RING-H2 finger protein ATL43 [Mercurialis annua]
MKNKNALFIFFFFSFSLFQPLFADVDSRITPPPDASHSQMIIPNTTSSSSSYSDSTAPFPPPPPNNNSSTPFKPSIAVIFGVLTTMFSITLLLLLYAKHCKRSNFYHNGDAARPGGGAATAPEGRKNSGIDRAVIESLPIFRFSSLRGQKHGLECAVCLTKFDPQEVLRLLPKCKHAFHVECVDTWLDAHSTCPLCRYRVDPEDILLIDQENIIARNILSPPQQNEQPRQDLKETVKSNRARRISGRHSSAGEKATNGFDLKQIVVQRPCVVSERVPQTTVSSTSTSSFARRSLDSYNNGLKKKNSNSISSISRSSHESASVAVGCFDRFQSNNQRKDGLLLLTTTNGDDHHADDDRSGSKRASATGNAGAGVDKTRFEHRIIVSGNGSGSCGGFHSHQRWSDVQPSDLLYLRSEMIISDSRRLSGTALGSRRGREQQQQVDNNNRSCSEEGGDGRSVINSRSVSEITGLNRFSESDSVNSRQHRERQAGVVSRWLAWISSQSHPAVRSLRTTTTSTNTPLNAAV